MTRAFSSEVGTGSREESAIKQKAGSATLLSTARRFAADERGGTAIEYALVGAGIAVAIAGTIQMIGSDVRSTLYDKLSNLL